MQDFFSFDSYITPRLVKILFVLGLVAIAIGTFISIGYTLFVGGGFFSGIVMPLLFMAIAVLGLRIYCEMILVFFDMRDRLRQLAERPRL